MPVRDPELLKRLVQFAAQKAQSDRRISDERESRQGELRKSQERAILMNTLSQLTQTGIGIYGAGANAGWWGGDSGGAQAPPMGGFDSGMSSPPSGDYSLLGGGGGGLSGSGAFSVGGQAPPPSPYSLSQGQPSLTGNVQDPFFWLNQGRS